MNCIIFSKSIFCCTNKGRGLNPFPKPGQRGQSVCGLILGENPKGHGGRPSI